MEIFWRCSVCEWDTPTVELEDSTSRQGLECNCWQCGSDMQPSYDSDKGSELPAWIEAGFISWQNACTNGFNCELECCGLAYDDVWECTLKKFHSGRHVAHNIDSVAKYTWP